MALFPAYSARSLEEGDDDAARWPSENDDAVEEELLASDTEEEMDTSPETEAEPAKNDDYYVDCKMDNGNRRVSTLYYPGRPQYERSWYRLGEADGEGGQRPRPRRYFRQRVPDSADATEIHERAATLRKSLDDSPHDTELWERYIDFMETYGGEKDVIDAVELAITKNRRSRRVRMRWYSIMRRNLPPQPYAERLRQCLAKEQDLNLRLELWLQLMQASGAAAEIGAVTALASAALHDTRALPRAYPDLLYAYGVWVRAAGLWEQLVQLIELVAAMNYPRAAFPPPRDLARERCREMKLRNIEDKIIESGLPLPTVWVRVERARAAAHWRPYLPPGKEEAGPSGEGAGPGGEGAGPSGEGAGPGAAEACPLDDGGDPQRSPLPHDVAELLQPVVDPHQLFRLSVRMLMLAKVPLLCGSGWSMRGSCGAGGDFECGEELLGALSTARALPPRHAAYMTPDIAQRMLALFIDPPHYFTDEYGYLTWVNSLWEACCGWASGVRRTALLCWRLRWLRALLLVAHAGSAPAATGADSATADAEIRRMRADAQCILRRLAGSAPLPFAEWARLEAAVGGVTGATRAARHALRAAIDERDIPHHHVLYIARVACEVGTTEGQPGLLGVTSLVAAVLRQADLLVCGAKHHDLVRALEICEEKCNELQHESRSEELGQGQGAGAGDEFEEDELSVLLPAPAEWGAVRALLYSPWHRARVLTALIGQPYTGESAAGGRFWEQQATALAAAAGSAAAARALAHYCPHSYYLNIVGSSAPLWAQVGVSGKVGVSAARGVAALAALLPALGRALISDWAPRESEALARVVRRVVYKEGGCGVLGVVLRLEAEGHAARPRLPHALYSALATAPHHKWLYVRGAAWCGGEAAGLADALLDKLLRLHALPHELQPLLDAHHHKEHRNVTSGHTVTLEHSEVTLEHTEVTLEHSEVTLEHSEVTPEHAVNAEPDARDNIGGYIFNEPIDVFDEGQRVPLEERRGYEVLRDENDAADEGSRGT